MTTAAAADSAVTSARELLERARALVPALRSRQAETDSLSKASETTVAELEAAGLFSMTVPASMAACRQACRHGWKQTRNLAAATGALPGL